jgi:Protein of unknown function (DUF3306)
MSEEKQDFLRRWSRLKRESAASSPVKKIEAEKPIELPALDSLTFESDFKAFMHSKVEQTVKRAALKKLFADPRFNVMDGLDTYIDDYTKSESIPQEMLAQLQHVQQRFTDVVAAEQEPAPEESPPQGEAPADTAKNDGDPAQDAKAL